MTFSPFIFVKDMVPPIGCSRRSSLKRIAYGQQVVLDVSSSSGMPGVKWMDPVIVSAVESFAGSVE